MSEQKKQYNYSPRGCRWAVYDAAGHKITDYATREEASDMVYKLNGWKKKESNE